MSRNIKTVDIDIDIDPAKYWKVATWSIHLFALTIHGYNVVAVFFFFVI